MAVRVSETGVQAFKVVADGLLVFCGAKGPHKKVGEAALPEQMHTTHLQAACGGRQAGGV